MVGGLKHDFLDTIFMRDIKVSSQNRSFSLQLFVMRRASMIMKGLLGSLTLVVFKSGEIIEVRVACLEPLPNLQML